MSLQYLGKQPGEITFIGELTIDMAAKRAYLYWWVNGDGNQVRLPLLMS